MRSSMSNRPFNCAVMAVRPYQILCAACAAGGNRAVARRKEIAVLLNAVREKPDRPLCLVCNAGGVYHYQDPGSNSDWPAGPEFNRKRDLDILSALNWPPGIVLPARTIFTYMLHSIKSVLNVCGHTAARCTAWRGCRYASGGFYEKVRRHAQESNKSLVFGAFAAPRNCAEMEREKHVSLKKIQQAQAVGIRPHLLLCAVCQYGGGTRPPYKPDNLPEMMQLLLTGRKNLKIKLVAHADWMMCAPCSLRVPGLNACVNGFGSGGLANEKRDLDVLCRLRLRYGSVLSGRRLYRMLFEKIPNVEDICLRDQNAPASAWWDGCITTNYAKGRKELMRLFRFI